MNMTSSVETTSPRTLRGKCLKEESPHDAHCGKCGSLLCSLVRETEFVHVTLGTLVDAPSIRPSAHIFVGSKAPWYTITDDLPQHDEFG